MKYSPEVIAANWIAYQTVVDDANADACCNDDLEDLGLLVIDDPIAAIEVVKKVYYMSSDPWIRENLGAGPVENL